MAQTPKSISTVISDPNLATTIYTCPAGTTAVVRTVIGMPATGGGSTFGVGKTVSGNFYPAVSKANNYTAASGATSINNVNLLDSPINLSAGESLTMTNDGASYFVFPQNSTFTNDTFNGVPQVYEITFANSIWMAVGKTSNINAAFVATSSDGLTWTQQTSATAFYQFTDVAYISTGNLWVAISGANFVISTNNGVTWTLVTASLPDPLLQPYQLASNGTTTIAAYAASGTGSNIWYTTNGTTWTAATNFFGSTSYGGASTYNQLTGISWSGSHWVTSQYGSTQITTDFTNWQFLGCSSNYTMGLNSSTACGIKYSSAYQRYYVANAGTSTANRSLAMSNASGDSRVWQYCTTSPAVAYCTVETAGSNTVLIARSQAQNNVRAKSTDGVNFTAGTDIKNWVGAIYGLENGYYYTQQSLNGGGWYASTDPITSTGTTFAATGAFYSTCAAADPTSGAWVILGFNNASTNRYISGSTAITGGASINNLDSIANGTYRVPTDVCWDPVGSRFYAVTNYGGVFYATAANAVAGNWTFGGWAAGFSFGADLSCNIRVVNSTIYVTANYTNNVIYIAPVGNTLTFVTYTVPNLYGNNGINKTANMNYPLYNTPYMATNGTNLVVGDYNGKVVTWVPANNRNLPSSPPAGFARVDVVNGISFAYGGRALSGVDNGGIYATTNLVTAYGYSSTLNQNAFSSGFPLFQKVSYANSTYIISTSANATMWSGSNYTNFNTVANTTSNTVAGVRNVSPVYFATDNTNIIAYNASTFYSSKTSNPLRLSATVTVSAVEIT